MHHLIYPHHGAGLAKEGQQRSLAKDESSAYQNVADIEARSASPPTVRLRAYAMLERPGARSARGGKLGRRFTLQRTRPHVSASSTRGSPTWETKIGTPLGGASRLRLPHASGGGRRHLRPVSAKEELQRARNSPKRTQLNRPSTAGARLGARRACAEQSQVHRRRRLLQAAWRRQAALTPTKTVAGAATAIGGAALLRSARVSALRFSPILAWRRFANAAWSLRGRSAPPTHWCRRNHGCRCGDKRVSVPSHCPRRGWQ